MSHFPPLVPLWAMFTSYISSSDSFFASTESTAMKFAPPLLHSFI